MYILFNEIAEQEANIYIVYYENHEVHICEHVCLCQ